MPNIRGERYPQGNSNTKVNYGDKATKMLFDDGVCFFSNMYFWEKIPSLKNFSSISINTNEFTKKCQTLNENFKKQFPGMDVPDICCTVDLPGVKHVTKKWTIAVMTAKKGGFALKICTEVRGNALFKILTDPENERIFHRQAQDAQKPLERTLNQLLQNATRLQGLANAVRTKYKENSGPQSDVVSKFNEGCYYYQPHYEAIKGGYFKLIPWIKGKYLMLPTKYYVRQQMAVTAATTVQSILGNFTSNLQIPNINQISTNQRKQLVKDWTNGLDSFLKVESNLLTINPSSLGNFDAETIKKSADLNDLEQYINYILS